MSASIRQRISGTTEDEDMHIEPLGRARAQRAEQQATRNIRQQQDSAYERSLAQDRERARKKKEEAERKAREEKEALEREQAKERYTQTIEQWRKWRANSIPGEPGHPIEWLRKNTILHFEDLSAQKVQELIDTRPKAAIISLVRNEEVEEMVASIAQVEARFNKRATHHYDWVFFNNEEFTEEFKEAVSKATNSRCYFERVDEYNWQIPKFIDVTRFDAGRQFMGHIGVGKAWLQSYHHMCRWNAGLFALEKRLEDYDWFWRVEPGVS